MDNIYTILINISPSIVSFILTFLLLYFMPFGKALLGADRGRKFAVGSEVNIGKPTGVGFYFVLVIAFVIIGYRYMEIEIIFLMALLLAAMMTGFLDDRSKTPWNEYIKGALDFVIAIFGALIATICFPKDVIIGLTGTTVHIPAPVYFILAVMLIIVSINATNATDGVDGLSGSLTIVAVFAVNLLSVIHKTISPTSLTICEVVIGTLFAYLIFNFHPSKMLMGDAGSRALGLLIAIYVMYVNIPFAYLVVGLPFILDGGLSILKITIGRLTKKKVIILKNTLTPIHDNMKKRKGFSVPQTTLFIVACALVFDVIYIGLIILLRRLGVS